MCGPFPLNIGAFDGVDWEAVAKANEAKAHREAQAAQREPEKFEPPSPEHKLALMFLNELDVGIHPQALRIFIRANWRKVSALAHAIHGDENG